MRIVVIGNSGGGKSILARRIADRLAGPEALDHPPRLGDQARILAIVDVGGCRLPAALPQDGIHLDARQLQLGAQAPAFCSLRRNSFKRARYTR